MRPLRGARWWRDLAVAALAGGLASLAYGVPSPRMSMTAGYVAVLLCTLALGRRTGWLTVAATLACTYAWTDGAITLTEMLLFTAIALPIVVLGNATHQRLTEGMTASDFFRRFQEDRQQRALLDHLPKMVWIAEGDGTTRYHNRYWYEYSGLSGDRDWLNLVHPDDADHTRKAWTEAMQAARPLKLETRLRRADGEYRWHLVNGVPILGVDGRVQCWYGGTTDIEDQRRAVETLEQANQRVSRFLAVLSHELRNPMAGMSSACEVLGRGDTDETQRLQALVLLQRQNLHLRRIVDDLLDISRVTQGKIELRRGAVELTSLADEVHHDNLPFARAHGVVLDTPLHDGPCHADGDRARLRQVMDNLLSNAIKACSPNQHVMIHVHSNDVGEAVITVRDEGQGLTPEFMGRMFEPFVQSATWQSRGLGLGLSIVKHIAELHGGRVTAYSDGPGYGASFSLHLPLLDKHEVPASAIEIARPGRAVSAARLLLVEDEVDNARTLQTLLALEGHEVEIAPDAETALRLCRERRFDVVVCDLELRDGPSGYEVARVLATESTPPYLIAYSGYGQQLDNERTRQAGFQRHLVKPATLVELLSAIEEGLRQHRRPSHAGPSPTVTT